MMPDPIAAPPAAGSVSHITVTAPPRAAHQSGFDMLLSELNPLQYLPVIGSIYRAMTGDTISEEARIAGSLVVSGLTGGPVGVAMNVAALAVEKVTGVDPEKIGQGLLADIGIGHRAKAAPKPGAPARTNAAVPAATATPAPAPAAAGWSAAQLAAYGVTVGARGTLRRGSVEGSDVLNDLELTRLRAAA